MRATRTMQVTALMAVAVSAGLLGVQGTWALWSAAVVSDAGVVRAADFRVDLNGVDMAAGDVSATIDLAGSEGGLVPGSPILGTVTVANVTNASGPFEIEASMGEASITDPTSPALGTLFTVRSAAAQGENCAAADLDTTSSARIAKGGSATFCVEIALASDAPASLSGAGATVRLPVDVHQVGQGT